MRSEKKKKGITNQDKDCGCVYDRLSTGIRSRIGGRGQGIKDRLGGRGSKWNTYNRRRPSPSPRNQPPFRHGFRNNYTSKPTQATFTNIETHNQNQPGRSTDYYSNWNTGKYGSKQEVFTRNWDKQEYGSGAGYVENNKNQDDNSSGPGYYTDREKNLESKKPDCFLERENNLVNSRPRKVIERDSNEDNKLHMKIKRDYGT